MPLYDSLPPHGIQDALAAGIASEQQSMIHDSLIETITLSSRPNQIASCNSISHFHKHHSKSKF
jgi:hypothetical protein